jgi:hypothetical protein
MLMGALMRLVLKDGPSWDPDACALEDMLAADAVQALFCIMSSFGEEAVLAAIELLQVIARDPRGIAAIAGTHCARPLITALSTAFNEPLVDPGDNSTWNIRAYIAGIIGRLVEGRPEVGNAFLAAGLVREMADFLGPGRHVVERKFAMELADKLVRHAPGACDAMKAEGVFTRIHHLTAGEPSPVTVNMIGRGEVTLSMYEEEPSQAQMLLFAAAAQCGGVLEIAETGKKPAPYTSGRLQDPHPGTWEATLTPPSGAPPAPPAPFPLCIYGRMGGPGTQGPLPTPSARMPQATPPPNPATQEASPTSCLGMPEAGAAPSPGMPKAAPSPCRGTGEAGAPPSPGMPEVGAPPSPGTQEAASTGAAAHRKLCSGSHRTLDPAPAGADGAGRRKPPHQTLGTPVVITAQPLGRQKLPRSGPSAPEASPSGSLPHPTALRSSRRMCSMCGAVSQRRFQVCMRCRRAAYCGRDCQAAHWPVHKSECRG